MKYVPSLPPPRITGVWDRLTVTGLAAIKAAKAVQPRTLQPLVTPQQRRVEPVREEAERRHGWHSHTDRRIYCRRILHLPVLFELRSGVERRRHNQRADDPTEHIDVKA